MIESRRREAIMLNSGGSDGQPRPRFEWTENPRQTPMGEEKLQDIEMIPFSPAGGTAEAPWVEDTSIVPGEYVMSAKNKEAAAKAARAGASVQKMNTLKGVFLPCVQNIMGVILFIRLPFITGEAGAGLTMLIIFLSKLTTLLTTLSMSAIATNGTVQAGGPYYMISRNLGVEIGGAIGTLFYLGTTMAASIYVLGAVETISSTFSVGSWPGSQQVLALVFMALLSGTVGVGGRVVDASSTVFLGMVFFSIASIIVGVLLFAAGQYNGGLSSEDRDAFDSIKPHFTEDPDTGITPTFFSLLALFFPSATGIMAGCNRSAALATPGKSIPTGTLNAIAFTTMLYVLFTLLFGSSMSHETLIDDKLVAAKVAWPTQYLVSLGIVFSSCGAAMQCIVGASRLLAAIANDRTIPFLVHFAPPPDKEPSRAVVLTWILASIPCLAGNLDYISPVVTMFFLLMYGAINFSCFVLSILQSPGFRPEWKYYSWHTALLGCLMCVAIMLIISWKMAVIAIFLAFTLLFYVKYNNATRDWGDTLVGFRFQLARDMLLSLSYREMHPKNWRPQLLVFCKVDEKGNPTVPELLTLAGQMKMGRGLLMAIALMPGDIIEDTVKAKEAQRVLNVHLVDESIDGFSKVSICQNVVESAVTVMHHTGIGTMQPNTVLFGWPEDWSKNFEKGTKFVSMLRGAVNAQKAVMVLKGNKKLPSGFEALLRGNTIDIWWVAHDGGLLLLVPYLLTLHRTWKRCSIRLFSVVMDGSDVPSQVERDVQEYLEQVRIKASVRAIDLRDTSFNDELYRRAMEDRAQQDHAKNAGVAQLSLNSDSRTGAHNFRDKCVVVNSIIEGRSQTEPEELESEETPHPATADMSQDRAGQEEDVMRTAFLLNRSILQYSSKAKLVVTNLPLQPKTNAIDLLGYVEAISDGIAPVLLIKGTGAEVVTTYG